MRRNRLEIIRSILDIASRGATKTQIVYRSNLNFKLANELLARLLKAEYVMLERPPKGRVHFRTTVKGLSFLQEIERTERAAFELSARLESLAR